MRSAAHIDLDALRGNVEVLRARTGTAQVMVVVKADGYGHGMLPSAHAAVAGGATWLGVAFVEEALALRADGLTVPVLAWLHTPLDDLLPAVVADVDLGAYDLAGLARVQDAARRAGRCARVQLKVDTGLSRGGSTTTDWPALCAAALRAEAEGTVLVTGIWSHLAFGEAGPDHRVNVEQAAAFDAAVTVAEDLGLRPQVRHLANSAAALTDPGTHHDLVRIGIAAYGLSPVPEIGTPADFGLRPVMTLVSHVALVKQVPAGSGVGYVHRYLTDRATALALVPLGYGDGIPRSATNTAEVWLAGARRRIAGTVSMDQFVLDVGDDVVSAGDEVLLFGPGDRGEPTAQDWATALGTIDYEIVTRIGARVPRVHTGGQS